MHPAVAPRTQPGAGFSRTNAVLWHAIRSLLSSSHAPSADYRHAVDRLEPRVLLAGNLTISEFMASNTAALADKDGDYSDWIEIHNAGSSPANLKDYHLTDDATDLNQWDFPDVPIGADGYLVVFASNKNLRVAGQELHTNFNLNAGGDYLALVEPDAVTIVSQFGVEYPPQQADISYGIDPAGTGTMVRYFATPTPGKPNARSEVVINEIHFNPDVDTELVEFIELYNPGSAAVDLSDAAFTKGIDYTFPDDTSLPAGGYQVVAAYPDRFALKFGRTTLGPYAGKLSADGDDLILSNKSGGRLDEVNYGAGFPWPTVGDPTTTAGTGKSIQLINPDFDNNLAGNWRSALPTVAAGAGPQDQTLFAPAGAWTFRKGIAEASTPKEAWRNVAFVPAPQNPEPWYNGTGPIGYDANVALGGSPQLADMKGKYSSFFIRKTFTVTDPSQIGALRIEAQHDDGFVVWINGEWAYTENVTSSTPNDNKNQNPNVGDLASGNAPENFDFLAYNLSPTVLSKLVAGANNVIAVQVFNSNLGSSSDAFFDCRLIASPKAASAAGAPNTPIAANNAPPAMRQVKNTPQQPLANQPVTIAAKITDPDGVASASLKYQIVDPGNYIAFADAAYNNAANWTTVVMNDAGANGDTIAGDATFTAIIPASVQVHRRLVRYRITTTDNLGVSITAPYADDPQPNFAYYCYNGIPAWSGAIQPGSSDPAKAKVVTYSPDVMGSVPAYQLIAKQPDVEAATWAGNNYEGRGTLVYDGIVYDGVVFRARGGVWRYAMVKNMWKLDFLRNHEFQAHDDYGNPYAAKWNNLNLGACIQQGDYWNRGEQGLYESVGFKLFNLAGTPASNTNFAQFRVVDATAEANPANQYEGDFWGLYLAVEQMDGQFLDEHSLPDGNLYKMESGAGGGTHNNQGPTQPTEPGNQDLVSFVNYSSNDQWWRDNVNLDAYYSYRAIIEAIHHGDVGYGKNYFLYHDPVTNKWTQLPWDLDLTWAETMYGNGNEPFKSRVLYNGNNYSSKHEPFNTEYRNRLREILDLLYNPEQTGQLIDEMAAKIWTKAKPSFVDADRAMWDYNPRILGGDPNKAGQGRYYAGGSGNTIPAPGGFEGMINKMKAYINYANNNTRNWMGDPSGAPSLKSLAADPAIPGKPLATYIGSAAYPINSLQFRSSSFVGNGGSFAAMKWRIAQITPTGQDPKLPKKYEIIADWESAEITTFATDITLPPDSLQVGKTYRVRVRMKDSTGRWSNWSDALQFVAGAASNAPVKDSLRITELMYNPASPPADSIYERDDFEFIELKNTGSQTINLLNVAFSQAVEFQFGEMNLAPGQLVLLVKNLEAFKSRYRTAGMNLAGQYISGRLNNAGETVELLDAAGQVIESFTYDGTWYPTADGLGNSLVAGDPRASNAVLSTEDGWWPSRITDGTPGADENKLASNTIVINEALTHTNGPFGDWIELYNTSADTIYLAGWWLSDDPANPTKYQIQPGTLIDGHDFVVFTQLAQFDNPDAQGVVQPFALSELGGDEIVLSSATPDGVLTGYRAKQRLDAAKKDLTLGRYVTTTGDVDFTQMSSPTMGFANSPPLVGPVVINEIMYHPPADGHQFIELRNISTDPVMLYDPLHPGNTWRFETGVTYSFPSDNLTLQPNELVLVVPTHPDAFRSKYHIPDPVRIFGPFAGVLSPTDENITLTAPNDPEIDGSVGYYIVDRVHYRNVAPWPTDAAGFGASLARLIAGEYGNDPANWDALANGGNPGLPNFDATPPTVTIHPVTPDPRDSSASFITITFSEKVASFDLSHLTLTRNGSPVAFGNQTLASPDDITYTLANLSGLTWLEGAYALSLNPAGITDLAGNALTPTPPETFTLTASTPPATSAADTFYFRLNNANLEIYQNAQPPGSPAYIIPLSQITQLNLTLGAYRFDSDLNGLGITVSGADPASPTKLILNTAQHFSSLTIDDNAQVSVAADGNRLLQTLGLSITGNGVLDLADNDLIIQSAAPSAALAQVFNWIKTARTAGTWSGPGIKTTKFTDATGLGVALTANSVRVKYTWNGDANLDGIVNADDYFLVDSGFITQQPGYENGDMNYDGTVNADDYFLIDSAYIAQSGQLATAMPTADWPQLSAMGNINPMVVDLAQFNATILFGSANNVTPGEWIQSVLQCVR
ncbi:MAG: lamin tail domain-containing protein [Planctomycetota bacterium]|nr:lamin tail domain-containing protein [Planctomycetota bacterium]